MKTSLHLPALAAAALVLASCSPAVVETPQVMAETPASEPTVEAPSVVVTTTILGSVVGDILTCAVGDDASMTVLMPIGADPHDFQLSSAQVSQMLSADLVVINGLFLEEGAMDAIKNVEADGANVLEVAALVDPLPFAEEDDHDDHGHGHDDDEKDDESHDHGDFDPHFWFDMTRMATAAELVGSALAVTGGDVFEDCGKKVADDIRDARAQVVAILEEVPEANRVLITDHDAFGYFAAAYGYEVAGVVIPGGSTLSEADSRNLAKLVTTIRKEGVSAIFGNTATSPQILQTLAQELGGEVQVVELFVGSLGGPGSQAESYIAMMTTNANLIAAALAD